MRQTGKTNCRVNYRLSQPYSLKSTVRQGAKAAKTTDATGKNGCSYTCQATLSSIWLGFWMAE